MTTVLVRHTTKYDKRSGRSSIIKYRGVMQTIAHFVDETTVRLKEGERQCVTNTGDMWVVRPNGRKFHHGERMADYVSVR